MAGSLFTFASFNCKNVKRCVDGVKQLRKKCVLIALQETWLLPDELSYLNTIDDIFCATGTSAVDTTVGMLRGRPHGGVALLWNKTVFRDVSVVQCDNPRICAIKIVTEDRPIIVISVYMPTNSADNLPEFTDCIGVVSAIVDEYGIEHVYIMGDINAHPGELFFCELMNYCDELDWCCIDVQKLGVNSGTFISDARKLAGYKGIQLCERLYKQYGPIVRLDKVLGGYDTIFLFDPEAIGQVFRSEDPMPVRPGFPSMIYYYQRHNKTYDPKRLTGLGTDHGENWKRLRTMVNPIMLNPKTIRTLYSDVIEEIAEEMIMRLRSIRDENNKITKDLNMEMNLWALESIGMVALGTRLHCFAPDLPSDSPVTKLVRVTTDIFNVFDELDYSPSLWRLFATPTFKRGMKIYEENERLTKYFIDKARENYKQRKSPLSEAEKPLLEKLLDIDVEMAYIVAMEFLLGGFETTATTVVTTLYLLATNPEKQEKLREEVLSKDSKKTYLRACIKESMRVQPVSAIGNVRQVTKEYNLLGYHIPKNVQIVFAQNYTSVADEHYPRAAEFIPERWLVDKKDPLYHGNTHPFATAPWGFGVRMCIGRRLAELEIETIVSKVISNFHLDWSSAEPIQIAPSILNYVKEPLHFVFKNLPDTTRVK